MNTAELAAAAAPVRVVRENDYAYSVRDQKGILGYVVRHVSADGIRHFRAFGEDFPTLQCAAWEFTKIAHAKLFLS